MHMYISLAVRILIVVDIVCLQLGRMMRRAAVVSRCHHPGLRSISYTICMRLCPAVEHLQAGLPSAVDFASVTAAGVLHTTISEGGTLHGITAVGCEILACMHGLGSGVSLLLVRFILC
jgi:hypothetical protein